MSRPLQLSTYICCNCEKLRHLRTQCSEQKKLTSPGQLASNCSSVLFISRKARVTNANWQPVTMGNRTVTDFCDTRAEVTLAKPDLVEGKDIIPGKFLTPQELEGGHSRAPCAYVFINWGAGNGMRKVGVSDEILTAVLLDADSGTLLSYYAPARNTLDAPWNSLYLPRYCVQILCKYLDNLWMHRGRGRVKWK